MCALLPLSLSTPSCLVAFRDRTTRHSSDSVAMSSKDEPQSGQPADVSSSSGTAAGSSGIGGTSSALPDPALPAPPLDDGDVGFTADQLIQRQVDLEEAAREAVPFSFTRGGCTYARGYIRQPVYACRTCGGGGVCAGCSVGCHAEHDLVELFAKRNFRCDCGTLSLCRGKPDREAQLAPCSLRPTSLNFAPQNDENHYSKNFEGAFCRCERGKVYDPEREEETMLQCLVCEDWLHESCTSLRPSKDIHDTDKPGRQVCDGPLVDPDAFELFICNECVRRPANTPLRNYIGCKGWIACLPEDANAVLPDSVDDIPALKVRARGAGWEHTWRVYGLENGVTGDVSLQTVTAEHGPTVQQTDDTVPNVQANSLMKRKAEADTLVDTSQAKEEPPAKKSKPANGLIVADDFDEVEQLGSLGADAEPVVPALTTQAGEECTMAPVPLFAQDGARQEARLDIYLTERFRDRICRCRDCPSDFEHLPFVLDEEETYSPPRSETSSQAAARLEANAGACDASSDAGRSQTSSTYDLGLAALNRLPRERMMESLQAYNRMRDALFAHLRPFADQGKVVDAESVRDFFRKQREQR